MASLRQIRRRMKSIESIHDITKAMEMIAAFRFKRAEGRFTRARAYLTEIEKLITNLSVSKEDLSHPFFEPRPVQRRLLVVVTGDKGLCGAYNTNLARAAQEWQQGQAQGETFFLPVGKVGHEYFRRRHFPFLGAHPDKGMVDLNFARKLTEELKALYLGGKVDSVQLLFTAYRAGGTGRPVLKPFLGLGHLLQHKDAKAGQAEHICEPAFDSLFAALLHAYLEAAVYAVLLESLTSEFAARMAAMKQATENGEEVLDGLKLLRNKTRQSTITRELSEIVSGANALV